ncbi:hypothetical protein NT01EI_0841 [Edwardsiella ictaluri 93-146]|uniref:Uncharacterized protein n=1 Tax=Edwardsiella ictaluri (strain 93-146) TaxID=634503 RepID=C5BHC0_EDWI9|nr:hypothetical protein NT01EI_0841 [Edwardsiella ictaluri 93-146]
MVRRFGNKRRFGGAFVCSLLTRLGDGAKFAGEVRWVSVSCSDLTQ